MTLLHLERMEFRAMGTRCAVAVNAMPRDRTLATRCLAAGMREVGVCERVLSRFDPDSHLSLLNRLAGEWVAADDRLIEALAAAERGRRETAGRFDPVILPALVATGYDDSFELLVEREREPIDGWRAGSRIEIDPASSRARIEQGTSVDLGGIGKGFAAARALRAMRAAWPASTGAIVDLGGDIALWGTAPEGGAWRVDVADPRAPGRTAATLELAGGGVATSGRDTRRFGPGRRLHHLIDPRTGTSAASGPLAVTVVAGNATEAEVHATALAMADVDEARRHIAARPDLAALLIPHTGEPIALGRLPLFRERVRLRVAMTPQSGRTS